MNLPPGFHFYPTDEELVVHFLQRKTSLLPCHPDVIPDLDLYPYDPWDLDGKAMVEGNKWYFYSRKTENRMTGNGYWESLGADEPILSTTSSTSNPKVIGIKKHYAFYIGEGSKTNWIMQEYMIHSDSSSSSNRRRRSHSKLDSKWVICRVYERDCDNEDDDDSAELSCLDEVFLSLDDLDDDVTNLPR